jgi:hypothetical protein
MTRRDRGPVERLNWILKFASRSYDVTGMLAKGDALRDQLWWVIYREGKWPREGGTYFNVAATDAGIIAASKDLTAAVLSLLHGGTEPTEFPMRDLTYHVLATEHGFSRGVASKNMTTLLTDILLSTLVRLELKPTDILQCANVRCRAFHVPLRAPRPGSRSFCSPGCARIAATQAYRERQKKAKATAAAQRLAGRKKKGA